MTFVITCECGYVIRGASEEELVRSARAHISANHPVIAAEASDADYVAMAEWLTDEDDA
jgi:predicted small metal-binding protein